MISISPYVQEIIVWIIIALCVVIMIARIFRKKSGDCCDSHKCDGNRGRRSACSECPSETMCKLKNGEHTTHGDSQNKA